MLLVMSFVVGLVFGLGLILSGMANPAKVLGFLDLAGPWDPSLALVMAGAIAVAAPAFFWARKRRVSLLGAPMQLSTASRFGRRLVLRSLPSGAGSGLAGFCPGPALVALGMGVPQAYVFVLAMLVGMLLFEAIERLRATTRLP